MAKNKISEFSSTAASNTDISNINIAEGCSPANVNNAIRGLMAQLKDFQSASPTYYTSDSDALAVGAGGTGAITASTARTNLSAAKSGANSDITSITGLTTALSTAQGGTGAVQKAISNVARTSNVVTITTSTSHGFTAGTYVTVTAVTNTSVNGTFLIATVGTNTFTYAQTAGDITSTADTGTAVNITYCNLTQNVTGTLSVANGGTGVATNSPNAILVGNATSAISSIKPGANSNVLTSTAGDTVNAGSFVVGTEYTILTLGSTPTDFTLIGASSNTVGVVFTATGVGAGNGTATINKWESVTPTLISGTSVATTSGSTVSLSTTIPSWVKRITLVFDNVSLSSGGQLLVRLGTSGGIVSTGYDSTSSSVLTSPEVQNNSAGFIIALNADSRAFTGTMNITLLTTNKWVSNHCGRISGTGVSFGGGGINLGGTLTQIQLATTAGNFDAGSANIIYE